MNAETKNESGKKLEEFYPFGVQYHRAPTPLPEEWAEDLRRIAAAGYTHVQYRPQWRWHERLRGHRTWDDLDRLFDLASTNRLRVVLKPMLETAPDWVFEELGGRRIGFHGVPISPFAHGAYYVGGWWPCFDNPQVVSAASEFVRDLVVRYRGHPALWMYNAWNEPVSRPLGQCQCCHSTESYRRWLMERFGTIEKLNSRLGKAWTSYQTLNPPSAADDYVEMFLWRQWATHSVAGQVQFVADAIRMADPGSYVIAHAMASSVVLDPAWSASDDLLNAKAVDQYGVSLGVPLHPKTPVEHAMPDYVSDWMRRVDSEFLCHEFYPNHGGWCRPPAPHVLSRLIWMAIAGGASGLTFWQYRSERVGNETNGFGLREIDGSPTPRSDVADGIAAVLREHGSRLIGTRRPRSRVALLYSRESDLILRIQAMKGWGAQDISDEGCNVDYAYKQAVRSAHAMYLMAGETVDWVIPGDDLSGVDLLHVSCAEMIDSTAAGWLRSFVRAGGKLIVEFPFACRDDNTWVSRARPTHGLDELLGCVEGDRVRIEPTAGPDHATFGAAQIVRAVGWKTELIPTDGKVLARWQNGSVAAVSHRYGKGQVIVLGVSLSLAFTNAWDDPVMPIFSVLLEEVCLEGHSTADRLWIRRRCGIDREIWLVFNLAHEVRRMTLPAMPRQVWHEMDSVRQGARLELAPGATWVGELPAMDDIARYVQPVVDVGFDQRDPALAVK